MCIKLRSSKIGSFIRVSHLVQKLLAKNTQNDFSTILKRCFTPFPCSGQKNSSAIRKSAQNMTGVEISVRFEALSQAQHYFM